MLPHFHFSSSSHIPSGSKYRVENSLKATHIVQTHGFAPALLNNR